MTTYQPNGNTIMEGADLSKLPELGPESTPDNTNGTSTSTNGHSSSAPLDQTNLSLSSLSIHADDGTNYIRDVAPPIHVSTTYRYSSDPKKLTPFYERGTPMLEPGENCYSRMSTSNTTRLESILSAILKNPSITYSSGLSALHAILVFFNPKAVSIGEGYHAAHGTLGLLSKLSGCKKLALDCPATDLSEGDLIWLETPLNPTGKAFDIKYYADKAHSRGAWLCVDSTFAPPPLQDPFKQGADVVMHSGTKYFGGHSDLLCGVVAVRNHEWLPKMLAERVYLGNVMGGLETWLGVRSLRTLELRVMKQSESATRIVDAVDGALTGMTVGTGLSQSDAEIIKNVVQEVQHASLQRDDYNARKPGGGWLKKQMPNGFGPVFALVMKSENYAKRLPSKLALFHHATSLGGVESLIEWRAMTDNRCKRELLRLSIGVEDERDLMDDLLNGFRLLAESDD